MARKKKCTSVEKAWLDQLHHGIIRAGVSPLGLSPLRCEAEAIIITWSCSANGSSQPHYSVVDVYFDSCCGFSWNLISFLHIVSLTCSMCPLNVATHILSAKNKTQHVEATAFVQKKIDKWMFRHCYSKAWFLAPYTHIGLQLGFSNKDWSEKNGTDIFA